MSKAARILVLAGAGYWAYSRGYLPWFARSPGPPKQGAEQTVADSPFTTSQTGETGVSRWEKMLLDHQTVLSQWAVSNLKWVAAMCMTENRAMNPRARGSAGELGVMQVKPTTALDLFEWGYGKMPPTAQVLTTTAGGLHYGTAYLQYLASLSADRDWITQAYNGGPGFQDLGADYAAKRAAYLDRVRANYQRIGGRI